MDLGIGRLFLRGSVFHGLVREEVAQLRDLHGADAHAAVLEKLARPELTTRYRGVLKEVERRLRPSRLRDVIKAVGLPTG